MAHLESSESHKILSVIDSRAEQLINRQEEPHVNCVQGLFVFKSREGMYVYFIAEAQI